MKIEEKLFQNCYVVDVRRAHIRIKDKDAAAGDLKALVYICPAGCWSVPANGQLIGTLDGCFAFGTCRVVASASGSEIEWSYPRGGFEILYRFD